MQSLKVITSLHEAKWSVVSLLKSLLRDVALPLFSQEELDKQQAKSQEASKVLEELAQRKAEVETQVCSNPHSL